MLSASAYLILVGFIVLARTSVRITNVKCNTFDPSFVTFEKCNLKVLGRGIIAMNIHAKLHQVPVSNITMNASLNKKANGYRPFLYNLTVDFCDVMKHRTRYPHFKLLTDTLENVSNINHTCPYDHDVLIDSWVLEEDAFRYFPLPEGEYGMFFKASAYNDWKIDVKTYFSIKGDLIPKMNRKKLN